MDFTEIKFCKKCIKYFPRTLEFFYKKKTYFSNYCKPCTKVDNKKNYKKHRVDYLEQKKEYYKENSTEIELKKKVYNSRPENIDKTKERGKKYREENKEKVLAGKKKYYNENKEKILAKSKEYFNNNKVKVLKQKNNYVKKRKQSDPIYKLKTQVSTLIRNKIKEKGYTKKSRTYKILGISFNELFVYLKKTFINNYKIEWNDDYIKYLHIDHIIPLSTVSDEEGVYGLNHYTNLQYLYCKDNMNKTDNLDWKLDLTKTEFYDILKEIKEI